jgi:hypothetical protein
MYCAGMMGFDLFPVLECWFLKYCRWCLLMIQVMISSVKYIFFYCFRFTQAGSEVSALLGNKSTRSSFQSSSSTLFDHHACIHSFIFIYILTP